MDRLIGNFQIPAGSLTLFFIAIMITLGFNDRVIMPLMKKREGRPCFTHLQKMATGLVLATFGMRAAQCARKRLAVAKANGGLNPLPIRVFFLLPQFLLVGYGNAFMPTRQLDFFITESPTGVKTTSTGLFLGTLSFGFFFSSLRVWIVNKVTGGKNGGWLAKTINQGRLDCFYGLLTILVVGEFEI